MIIAASIPMNLIVIVATMVAVTAVIWLLLDFFTGRQANAERRLDEISDRSSRVNARSMSKMERLTTMLEKSSPALAKSVQPKTEKEIGKLRQRLNEAGFRSEGAPTIFLGMKVLAGLFFVSTGGLVAVILSGLTTNAMIQTVIVGGLGFYIPEIALSFLGSGRKKKIFRGLPDALDLLVVCVEAGLGLDQGMRRVSEEMKKSHPIVGQEFALCNMHLQMGRARNQVLFDLGQRTGVDDLRALASILIQADKFGSSVATALRVQSDTMRTRRQQIAEEKAAKTAVKLIFPLVLFIFPGIFVVLVGPAGIQMSREMFPAMAGE